MPGTLLTQESAVPAPSTIQRPSTQSTPQWPKNIQDAPSPWGSRPILTGINSKTAFTCKATGTSWWPVSSTAPPPLRTFFEQTSITQSPSITNCPPTRPAPQTPPPSSLLLPLLSSHSSGRFNKVGSPSCPFGIGTLTNPVQHPMANTRR